MVLFGRSREGGRWGDLFAGLFGGALMVAFGAAMLWFLMIGPIVHAYQSFGNIPTSRDSVQYDGPEPTTDLSAEYPNGYDDYNSPAAWVCSYHRTLNDDWHDDVLCTNGVSRDRPYLLPDDSFVTDEELMREAARYEDYLNF